MKYFIILLLSFFLTTAQAGPVDNMANQCNQVMDAGLCRVALDPKEYPNTTIPVVLPTGVKRINTAVYLAIRALGFQKDDQGRWLMCQTIYDSCKEWDSDACVTYRTQYRQD